MQIPDNTMAWTAPAHWRQIRTIDAHTEGEPLRVYFMPELDGASILARRRHARSSWDHLRTALMWEPRGHADMYGCIITEAVTDEADFGVLFLHNEGYSSMCGHGIIGVTKVVLETGMMPIQEPTTKIVIDTPAGQVTAFAHVSGGKVEKVSFLNVASYVVALDETVEVEGLGPVRYDLAFGGAYYAYVQAADVGLNCAPEEFQATIEKGMAIKRAITASRAIEHPFETDLGFLYGTIFIAPPRDPAHHSRNVCIFAEGELDRSPTGTGVSGRAAILYSRGQLAIDSPITIESIIDSRFRLTVASTTNLGPHAAVVPRVEGRAFITGQHRFLIDPEDPLKHGFILR